MILHGIQAVIWADSSKKSFCINPLLLRHPEFEFPYLNMAIDELQIDDHKTAEPRSNRVPAKPQHKPAEVVITESGSFDSKRVGEDLAAIFGDSAIPLTTKPVFVDARLGQGQFRKDVLARWNNACAVTGSKTVEAIRASHIKPWRDSSDPERLDPGNGLPLVASLDALFDRGLISFADAGELLVTEQLTQEESTLFGLHGARLSRELTAQSREFLKKHRLEHGLKS